MADDLTMNVYSDAEPISIEEPIEIEPVTTVPEIPVEYIPDDANSKKSFIEEHPATLAIGLGALGAAGFTALEMHRQKKALLAQQLPDSAVKVKLSRLQKQDAIDLYVSMLKCGLSVGDIHEIVEDATRPYVEKLK